MKKMKVFTVIGTRPDIIKMAPVILELKNNPYIDSSIIFTGQHQEIGAQILENFGITPDYNLSVMKAGQSLSELNSKILLKLEQLFKADKPDFVLGHGDTTSCFATGLCCFYNKIRFLHIEAGLRSLNLDSPFPEEFNRQLVSKFAFHHFATDSKAYKNLLNDRIHSQDISIIGNTISDAISHFIGGENNKNIPKEKLITLTMHRREKSSRNLYETLETVKRFATNSRDYKIVYPLHPNPSVMNIAKDVFKNVKNVELVPPMDYPDFLRLLLRSKLVITDSGGIQEEASILNTKALIVRSHTERNDGIDSGNVVISGHSKLPLSSLIEDCLFKSSEYVDIAAVNSGASKKISSYIGNMAMAVA